MTLNHIFFSFMSLSSLLIKQRWWALRHGKVRTAKDSGCRNPERPGLAWSHTTREQASCWAMPELFVHQLASLGSGLLSEAWSVFPGLWQNAAEMFGAGLGPTWCGSAGLSYLSPQGLICPFSPFPQTNLSLSWKVPVSSPPPSCLSPGLSPETLASLPHRSKLFSTGGSELGWPLLTQDGTDGKPAVPQVLMPSPLSHPVRDGRFYSESRRYRVLNL